MPAPTDPNDGTATAPHPADGSATEPSNGPAASATAKDRVRSIARNAGAPVRNYVNQHFELTKQELRTVVAGAQDRNDARLVELSNVVAETTLHQVRVIAELRHEVDQLSGRIEELNETVASLTRAVSGLTPLDAEDDVAAGETSDGPVGQQGDHPVTGAEG